MDLQEASINRPAGSPGQQNQEINTLKKQLDENRKQVKKQLAEMIFFFLKFQTPNIVS